MKEVHCTNCGKQMSVSDELYEKTKDRKPCCSKECAKEAGIIDPQKVSAGDR